MNKQKIINKWKFRTHFKASVSFGNGSLKVFQSFLLYYLMVINRGIDIYLYRLTDYYYQEGRIDDMTQYKLMMIEKYNNKDAWKVLTKYYQNNLVRLIDLFNLHREINNIKNIDSNLIIRQIPINTRHFRFKDQSIGMKIINYHFNINQEVSEASNRKN